MLEEDQDARRFGLTVIPRGVRLKRMSLFEAVRLDCADEGLAGPGSLCKADAQASAEGFAPYHLLRQQKEYGIFEKAVLVSYSLIWGQESSLVLFLLLRAARSWHFNFIHVAELDLANEIFKLCCRRSSSMELHTMQQVAHTKCSGILQRGTALHIRKTIWAVSL